ncbi:MAG TPA: nucleotidyltransferase domain-containing protein [Thermodesulfovibrionia bacterium]|nr:nucleotidyltransferase domain-containing protein [Thermodesulfovibrionia bacterium]
MINIEEYKPQITQVCQSLPIKQLGLFGSVMTNNFALTSDIDVLVIFEDDNDIDYFDKYFELKECLEKILKRTVDLVVDKKFKNSYFQKTVDRTRKIVYEKIVYSEL